VENYVDACSDGIGVYSIYFLPLFALCEVRFGTEATGGGRGKKVHTYLPRYRDGWRRNVSRQGIGKNMSARFYSINSFLQLFDYLQ
jgi:hypothetical protein